MIVVPGAAGAIGVLARHAPLVAMLNAGSTRVYVDMDGDQIQTFATGPGFFQVLEDRAIALVDDAVIATEIDVERARHQLEEAQAELAKIEAGESTADRWQLEQRIRHAENQLRVSGASGIGGGERGREVAVRREVQAVDVLAHHAVRAELDPELGDRVPHHLDPSSRHLVRIALEERRKHLSLEDGEKRLRVGRVLFLIAPRRVFVADGEAAVGRVALGPPAVEDGAVEHAVQRRLHSRRARRLHRPTRGVEPDVHALDEPPRERHLVVGQEHDVAMRAVAAREVDHLADDVLAALVRRVRFAGDDDLQRAIGIAEQRRQPLRLAEQESRAFIRREPPRKTDRERLGIELGRATGARDELHEACLRRAVRLPEHLRRELERAFQFGRVRPEDPFELAAEPRAHVHAVRDRGDRHLVHRPVRPEVVPHLPRDGAVELRDAVRIRRRLERERRHPEDGVFRVNLAERLELVPRVSAALDERLEVPAHELGIEHFVAGRNGRVRGEDRRCAQALERGVTVESFFLDELAQSLELEERRVALVHVEHRRLEPERAQHADAADAEHELLAQPVLPVAAVQGGRHVSRPVGVPLHFRVEEVERDPADARAPDADADRHEACRRRPRASPSATSARASAVAGRCRCAGSVRPGGRPRPGAAGSSRGNSSARCRRGARPARRRTSDGLRRGCRDRRSRSGGSRPARTRRRNTRRGSRPGGLPASPTS